MIEGMSVFDLMDGTAAYDPVADVPELGHSSAMESGKEPAADILAKSVRKIIVVGSSGAGKTTLAAILANRLSLPFFETDGLFWTDDWRPVAPARIVEWLTDIRQTDAWVLDGNFEDERDLIWNAADLIVWLDLPMHTTICRVAIRNTLWWIRGSKVWGGKRMTFAKLMNGVRHAARSHTKRQRYPTYFAQLNGVDVVVLRSQWAIENWLADQTKC